MFMWGNKRLIVLAVLSSFTLMGCGQGVQFSIGQTSQSFTQKAGSVKNAIDVLWVVDNSSSMAPLQANLTSNFNSFISNFEALGYDFHMAVTTTDSYKSEANFSNDPTLAKFGDGIGPTSGIFVILSTTPNLGSVFVTNATTGINGSGDERAFSSMRDALNSPLNAGFLRTNSFLAVVILSDEDDFSNATRLEGSWGNDTSTDHCYYDAKMDAVATTPYSGPDHVTNCTQLNPKTPPDSVASYESYLDNLTQSTGTSRRYNVNAITVLDSGCQATHAAVSPDSFVTIVGQRYIQMSNDTNGVTGSICDSSYASALSKISNQITVLSTQFFLSRIPQINTIMVLVNGVIINRDPANGWTYNSASNSIQFHGSATPPQNAQISVNFTPVSIAD